MGIKKQTSDSEAFQNFNDVYFEAGTNRKKFIQKNNNHDINLWLTSHGRFSRRKKTRHFHLAVTFDE